MARRLHKASLIGNTALLHELLEEDELILERTLAANAPENPLHIVALRGHVEFAAQILSRRPELAHELNSQGLSPLHLASANGHVGVVKELLKFVPDGVSCRDREGRTPLHVAAAKGRTEVLEELVRYKPELVGDVMSSRGETVLHLCVKHEHMEALKMLVGLIKDAEFVSREDSNGNTILHLSAAMKHFPMIKFLMDETTVEVNKRNKNGLTALDVLAIFPRESTGEMEVAENLRRKGAKRAWELLPKPTGEGSEIASAMENTQHSQVKEESEVVASLASLSQQIKDQWNQEMKQKHDDDNKNTLMLIATLIVTVAFQATLTPPGGLWQDDSKTGSPAAGENHEAGTAILDQKNPTWLAVFWFFNKLAFFASLFLIFAEKEHYVEGSRSKKLLVFVAMISLEFMYITSSFPITNGTHKRVILADVGAVVAVLMVVYLPVGKWWRKYGCNDGGRPPKDDHSREILMVRADQQP